MPSNDVEKLRSEIDRLKIKLKKAESVMKSAPAERQYTIYLMQANALLEEQYQKQQEVIEAYQKHYERYSHFYADYEKRMIQ